MKVLKLVAICIFCSLVPACIGPGSQGPVQSDSSIGGTTGLTLPRDRPSIAACFIPNSLPANTKPKRSVFQKFGELANGDERKRVPSALAGLIIYSFNRFIAGTPASGELESQIYARFRELPEETLESFSCATTAFNDLDQSVKQQIVPTAFVGEQTLPEAEIYDLLAGDILSRASTAVFDDVACLEAERPGLARRQIVPKSREISVVMDRPIIYKINGSRTLHFFPPIAGLSLRHDEVQRRCETIRQGDEVELDCHVVVGDCDGNVFNAETGVDICMAVPEVAKGTSVLLEGVNFYDVDATVRLTAKTSSAVTIDVPAHVCGDVDNVDTSSIEGVRDQLLFSVPEDMPTGIYRLSVVMPEGDETAQVSVSDEIFLEIVSSGNDAFGIATESIEAVDETGTTEIGSDEVAVKMATVSFGPDLQLVEGSLSDSPIWRFDNVDSGDEEVLQEVLYSGNDAAVSIAILGYEVDSEKAFENQIDNFVDAFMMVAQDIAKFVITVGGSILGKQLIDSLKGQVGNPKVLIAAAIAIAIVVTVATVIAIWAPADLIIEDVITLSQQDLGRLTSPITETFPTESTSAGGIKIKVGPHDKTVGQCQETRTYRSKDNSTYRINLRYNQVG